MVAGQGSHGQRRGRAQPTSFLRLINTQWPTKPKYFRIHTEKIKCSSSALKWPRVDNKLQYSGVSLVDNVMLMAYD